MSLQNSQNLSPTALNEAQLAANAAKRAETGEKISRGLTLLLLVVGSIIFMIPFYIMFVMSVKSPTEIANSTIWDWPKEITWANYQMVLTNPNVNFIMFFKNTAMVAILSTIGVIVSSSMVAYAFARLKFPGRNRLFALLLSTMMLPGVVTMIPTYVMYAKISWVNTILPLVVPAFFGGGAFNVFLLRQFFMGIPRELDEAALIDGANHWKIFTSVILPLSGPALATVGIFSFIYNWKDFMAPLLYLNEPDKQTLEVGLSTYNSLRNSEWNLLMAGSVLVTIPLILIFLVGQRYFIKGIAMSGMK